MIDYTNSQASSGTIDPTSNIASKPIYMFSGVNDTTVHQAAMNTPQQYYETLKLPTPGFPQTGRIPATAPLSRT